MTKTTSAPATKQDVRLIMEELGKLYDANEGWKTEIVGKMETWKKEVIEGFHVVAENIHKDAISANKETIDLHRNRIENIENVLGLPHSLSA